MGNTFWTLVYLFGVILDIYITGQAEEMVLASVEQTKCGIHLFQDALPAILVFVWSLIYHTVYIKFHSYHPATKLWEGNVFTNVYTWGLSTHPLWSQVHSRGVPSPLVLGSFWG